MATRIYKTPFAATGDKELLATADQPDGKVSLQTGWTPDYELPNDNANYRPVGRAEMNGIINEITDGLGEIQLNGFAKWQAIDGGWPLGAQVSHGGLTYRSLIESNTSEPGVAGANWLAMGTGIATTAQAQALADDLALLTPKKLADAFMGANQSLAVPGFQKLPGGLIVQWGYVSGFSGYTVALPVAFPNRFLGLPFVVTEGSPSASTPESCAWAETSVSTPRTAFKIWIYRPGASGGAVATTRAAFWLAIGH